MTRIHASLEERDYADSAALASLDRDANVRGGGLEQTVPLPWLREGSYFSLGGRYDRTRTEGERDFFGLDSAYDHYRSRGEASLHFPLFWKIALDLRGSYGEERYDHRNTLDLLTDDGVGTLSPKKRRDDIVDGRIALSRPLTDYLTVELHYRGTWRNSNVDLYEYDRHIVGLHFLVATP